MEQDRINEVIKIKNEIKKLPKGYISIKIIRGNVYYYHQWTESGKKFSKYIPEEDLPTLQSQISRRQLFESALKNLKKSLALSFLFSCCLMHKDTEAIDLYIDPTNGQIKSVGNPKDLKHLPIGTANKNGGVNEAKLYDWWNNRSIPMSRSGIREALEKLNINAPQALLVHCYGLSLSDQYWIKPSNKELKWADVNFFNNAFSDDVGEILLGGHKKSETLDLSSPDNTSVGNLKKKWKISNNKRVLIKGGSNPFRQEPFNEVVACRVANALGIECVNYSLLFDKDYPYCECEDFIDEQKELVTAYQITQTSIKKNSENSLSYFLRCCKQLGIKNVDKHIEKMVVLDFIIANEDRHLNNFGFIRDVNSLEFSNAFIIYDNGGSFGFDKITEDITPFDNIVSKPFKSNPLDQLKLVKDFDWLTKEKLTNAKEIIKKDFESFESKYLDKKRIAAIIQSATTRIDYIINILD